MYKEDYFTHWISDSGSISVKYSYNQYSYDYEASLFGKAYTHISGDKVSGLSNLFEPDSYVFFRTQSSDSQAKTLYVWVLSGNSDLLASYALNLSVVSG